MYSILLGISLTLLLAFSVRAQFSPPLLPEEFAAYVLQSKWNLNGFGANHTFGGTFLSSYKNEAYRYDGAYFGFTNGTLSATVMMSLSDFSGSTPLNTYISASNAVSASCTVYDLTGTPGPQKSTFLSDIGAVYAGNDNIPFFGTTEKWSFMIDSQSMVTFHFTTAAKQWVRWDLASMNLQTGVVTYIFFLQEGEIPSSIFTGMDSCDSAEGVSKIPLHFSQLMK